MKKDAYLKTYSHMMHPIPDEHSWPDVQYGTVLPPVKKKRASRPKLQRKRGLNEGRKVPRSIGFRCSIFEEVGHNSRTCTNKDKALRNKKRKEVKIIYCCIFDLDCILHILIFS